MIVKYYITQVQELICNLCATQNLLPSLVRSNGSVCCEQQIEWQGEEEMGGKGQALMLHLSADWTPKRKPSSE